MLHEGLKYVSRETTGQKERFMHEDLLRRHLELVIEANKTTNITDPDQQHCNSIKYKEQPVLPDPDLCCVWYVPGDLPLYRIHGWNFQEPG